MITGIARIFCIQLAPRQKGSIGTARPSPAAKTQQCGHQVVSSVGEHHRVHLGLWWIYLDGIYNLINLNQYLIILRFLKQITYYIFSFQWFFLEMSTFYLLQDDNLLIYQPRINKPKVLLCLEGSKINTKSYQIITGWWLSKPPEKQVRHLSYVYG